MQLLKAYPLRRDYSAGQKHSDCIVASAIPGFIVGWPIPDCIGSLAQSLIAPFITAFLKLTDK
jgi:hypothetical protein